MLEPREHNTTHPQPTPYYQRISGRLQRVQSASQNILPQIVTHQFSKSNQHEFCPYFIGGVIAILFCTILVYSIFPYPLHASCTVKWKFGEPCNYVIQRLRYQILKWSTNHNCGPGGSRCLYSLKDFAMNNLITATHISPTFKLSENIRISFTEGTDKSCIATGESISKEWFMVFDSGSNYCNLRNLVEGANFVRNHGFVELTTDSICTQLNMAVCK